jgi:uncharacterized protein (DUF2249 family)
MNVKDERSAVTGLWRAHSMTKGISVPWSAETRLRDVVAADPGVVERLTALDPLFACLRDGGAQALPGRLTTIADAAAVAGLPVEAVLIVIAANRPCDPVIDTAIDREHPEPAPGWLDGFDAAAAIRIDVRPLLARHEEPFAAIMQRAAEIGVGQGLVIEAPFNPAPLRRVLAGKGFASYGRHLEPHHWRIFCLRTLMARQAEDRSLQGARLWQTPDALHIDVRGLQPPAPMVAILGLIDAGRHPGHIIAHLDREPVFLFPQLDDRGWTYVAIEGDPDEVRLEMRLGSG